LKARKQLFPYLNSNLLERELGRHDLRRLEVLTDATRHINKYNDDEEKRLPIRCSKPAAARRGKLTEEHSRFLVEYVDEYPAAVLSDIKRHLCVGVSWTNYINLSITSTLGAKL
jgi:hypothetical protein